MKTIGKAALLLAIGLILPLFTEARVVSDSLGGLHGVLDKLYDEMMPLCQQLIGIGQGIAGFGATWYIASRVWRHIANAEPIDFYPLFRPFVLGFCIMIFPSVLDLINGVMKPAVTGTAAMVNGSDELIRQMHKRRMEALMKSETWKSTVGGDSGNPERWHKYTHDNAGAEQELDTEELTEDAKYEMSNNSFGIGSLIYLAMSVILDFIYEVAALCIDTMRTFHLIVLAILGPFAFGLAVFDGFQYTLTAWLARYINIYLWLPVANIFAALINKLQELMVTTDGGGSDFAYMVFMLIGIIGYFTVPSVANSIVNIGGGGALSQKVNNMAGGTVNAVGSGVSGITNSMGGSNHSANKLSGN